MSNNPICKGNVVVPFKVILFIVFGVTCLGVVLLPNGVSPTLMLKKKKENAKW